VLEFLEMSCMNYWSTLTGCHIDSRFGQGIRAAPLGEARKRRTCRDQTKYPTDLMGSLVIHDKKRMNYSIVPLSEYGPWNCDAPQRQRRDTAFDGEASRALVLYHGGGFYLPRVCCYSFSLFTFPIICFLLA
jgi:hypothetical protein